VVIVTRGGFLSELPPMLSTILFMVVVLFPAFEIALARFKRTSPQMAERETYGRNIGIWRSKSILLASRTYGHTGRMHHPIQRAEVFS
jgi:hypothetical protein